MLVRDMKNPGEKIGNDVWCDLTPEALQIILSMPRTSDDIFPYSGETIGTNFTRACQFLGIADLHLHDLRHDGVCDCLRWAAAYRRRQTYQATAHGRVLSAIPISARLETNTRGGNGLVS